jgi:hypothetical protein
VALPLAVTVQAAPRGLVTLDFNQNGDYYISDAVGGPLLTHPTCAQRTLSAGVLNCRRAAC